MTAVPPSEVTAVVPNGGAVKLAVALRATMPFPPSVLPNLHSAVRSPVAIRHRSLRAWRETWQSRGAIRAVLGRCWRFGLHGGGAIPNTITTRRTIRQGVDFLEPAAIQNNDTTAWISFNNSHDGGWLIRPVDPSRRAFPAQATRYVAPFARHGVSNWAARWDFPKSPGREGQNLVGENLRF